MTYTPYPRMVDLPGLLPARIDANICVCARKQDSEHGPGMIIHTSQGFAFPLLPEKEQVFEIFYEDVLSIIWPPKPPREKKRRSTDE